MASLSGQYPANTYTFLLQLPGGASSTLTAVEDGAGNNLPFQFSTSTVNVTGTFQLNGTTFSSSAFSGDITCNSSFVATIGNNKVTYAKMQQVAASSILGNATGSLANAEEITLGSTLAFSGTTLQTTALTGAVTSSANSFSTTLSSNAVGSSNISNSAVTYAKIQNETASTLLGNPSGSSAAPSEITLGSTLTFSNTALQTAAMTGDVTASANSFSTTIGSNKVSYAKMQQVSTGKLLGSISASTANIGEISVGSGLSLNSGTLSLSAGSISNTAQVFTSGSGTYTPTSGMTSIRVTLIGGGGGGGGTTNAGGYACGGGGGGGATLVFIMTAAQVGSSLSYAVGTGGSRNNGASGGAGGASTLGSWSAGGGGGGTVGTGSSTNPAANATVGSGGSASTSTGTVLLNLYGSSGSSGFTSSTMGLLSAGGHSIYGNGNPVQWVISTSGSANNNGALYPGEGGAGSLTINSSATTEGGAGVAGIIIIEELI